MNFFIESIIKCNAKCKFCYYNNGKNKIIQNNLLNKEIDPNFINFLPENSTIFLCGMMGDFQFYSQYEKLFKNIIKNKNKINQIIISTNLSKKDDVYWKQLQLILKILLNIYNINCVLRISLDDIWHEENYYRHIKINDILHNFSLLNNLSKIIIIQPVLFNFNYDKIKDFYNKFKNFKIEPKIANRYDESGVLGINKILSNRKISNNFINECPHKYTNSFYINQFGEVFRCGKLYTYYLDNDLYYDKNEINIFKNDINNILKIIDKYKKDEMCNECIKKWNFMRNIGEERYI